MPIKKSKCIVEQVILNKPVWGAKFFKKYPCPYKVGDTIELQPGTNGQDGFVSVTLFGLPCTLRQYSPLDLRSASYLGMAKDYPLKNKRGEVVGGLLWQINVKALPEESEEPIKGKE